MNSQGATKQMPSHGVNKLKPMSWIAFLLCDQENCSIEDVVDFLGMSMHAVTSRLLRARLKMREYLNQPVSRRNDPLLSCIPPSRVAEKEIDNGTTVSSTAS